MQGRRIWREPRALTPLSWIDRCAEVWNDVPEGDGDKLKRKGRGRRRKIVSFERGSVCVERFCVIINRVVSTCTGNVLRMIMKKHLFDV